MGRLTFADREARLRRSLKRLGYDLVDADVRGYFHIRRQGSRVNEMPDLFGLDLAGVEAWIRDNARKKMNEGPRRTPPERDAAQPLGGRALTTGRAARKA